MSCATVRTPVVALTVSPFEPEVTAVQDVAPAIRLFHALAVMVDTTSVEPAFLTTGVSCSDVVPAHEGLSFWFDVSYRLVRGRLLSIPVMRDMPSV